MHDDDDDNLNSLQGRHCSKYDFSFGASKGWFLLKSSFYPYLVPIHQSFTKILSKNNIGVHDIGNFLLLGVDSVGSPTLGVASLGADNFGGFRNWGLKPPTSLSPTSLDPQRHGTPNRGCRDVAVHCSGMQGDAVGFRGMQECQQQPKQAMVDDGRPSHCDIRSATSISNAFFASVHTQSNFHQSSHCCKMFHKYHIVFISKLLCNIEYMCFPCLSICPPLSLPCPSYMIHGRRYYTRYNIDNKYKIESEI